MCEGGRPAIVAYCRAEFVQADRAIRRTTHIVFARPRDFHRSIDGLRDQGSLDSVVVLEPASEAAPKKRDVHLDLLRLKPKNLRDSIAAILRDLRRRPDLALVAAEVGCAVARFHGCMGHEWKLVLSFDFLASCLRDIS